MGADHWFEELAEHMGGAYLRYAFTKGTVGEVDFLVEQLEIAPGSRVLDVGCGPGRHAIELARRGVSVVGIDLSASFVELAGIGAEEAGVSDLVTVRRLDARDMLATDLGGSFDAVYAMCQGAFGLQAGPASSGDLPNLSGDLGILAGMAHQLRPGGRAGVAAFSAYFQVRHLDDSEFDPLTATNHEHTVVNDPLGEGRPADLWTTCFTPRELWLMTERVGLEPLAVHGVSSVGEYRPAPPDIDEPEFFLVARRPS